MIAELKSRHIAEHTAYDRGRLLQDVADSLGQIRAAILPLLEIPKTAVSGAEHRQETNNLKPSYFRDLIQELMKEHFDCEGKPMLQSKVNKAIVNGIQGIQSGTKSSSKSSSKEDKKKDDKKKNKLKFEPVMFSAPPPAPGFVVNRDPPSGQSDDWNEEWEHENNMPNGNCGSNTNNENEPWP
ncbi:hypothetical protein B4U79_13290 [Dinothrombium tinctorium]|uniref:Uncharacterized protein n=1 Tax=Dinothrombium tinctorium TaxID=1965070 RepID=A0A3S3NHX3_9ACAR|nr:hypothetical protein B4U79_13290 [Dinothrombium tinctorium]